MEIERKFLVHQDLWLSLNLPRKTLNLKQGYLFSTPHKSLRVRVSEDHAWITLKFGQGIVRDEYEYNIPYEDALKILRECNSIIEKLRHRIVIGKHTWEVDEFLGNHSGLFLAEIELSSPDEDFEKPVWVGEEVTDDPRYLNANLSVSKKL